MYYISTFGILPDSVGKKKTLNYSVCSKIGISEDSFAATNIAELFLIGLRTKHLCSQVWRKTNYDLRLTENFENDILKMPLPFSLVYHNGIMSLSFINCNLHLPSFPVLFSLLSHGTISIISQLVKAEVNVGGVGVCDDDNMSAREMHVQININGKWEYTHAHTYTHTHTQFSVW